MKTILFSLAILTPYVSARSVEYKLTVAAQKVNITGKTVAAMTLNGSIPGPTLRFSDGNPARSASRFGIFRGAKENRAERSGRREDRKNQRVFPTGGDADARAGSRGHRL
jgi:hypothetical protein